MKHHYKDIRDKVAGAPVWWDEYGVPRYCTFHPREVADIYADQVALVLIQCQQCHCNFLVAMSRGALQPTLVEAINDHSLQYGDPPNVGCCSAGATMSSDAIHVEQFWHHPHRQDWVRAPEFERSLEESP